MNRLKSLCGAVALLTLALFAYPAIAQELASVDALLEPLPIRDQFLLNNGFFFFEPSGARVLPDGMWSLEVHSSAANTFSRSAWVSEALAVRAERRSAAEHLSEIPGAPDAVFLVDGETNRVTMAVRRGIGEDLEVGVSVPVLTIGGGWFDGLIERFHEAFGLGNAERYSILRDTETVWIRTPTVNYIRERSADPQLGDVALSAKYRLRALEDEKFSMAIQGAVELPTGDAETLDGSGSVDGGVQFIVTRTFPRMRLDVATGIIWLGANEPLGTDGQMLITNTLSASRLLSDLTAATLQLTVSETPFRGLGIAELDRRSFQLAAGTQHHVGPFTVHVAIIENLVHFNNGADFGFAWGVSRRFN